MTEQEIIEENKLIAEFMEWNNLDNYSAEYPNSNGLRCAFNSMEFNSSWDWLMPVVEKIRGIFEVDNFNINILGDAMIDIHPDNTLTTDEDDFVIETRYEDCEMNNLIMVHRAVVEFIKWYFIWEK